MSLVIGVLFSSYGPYHIARVEGLVKSPQIPEKQIVAIELARSQEEYPWKTKIETLDFSLVTIFKNKNLEKTNLFTLLLKLNHILNQVNPSVVVIPGYFQASILFTLVWCLWHGKPAILLSETTEIDAERSFWRETVKSWIVKKYKSGLVGGQPHKRYLIKLGMPSEAIFLGYNIVGNDTFHPHKIKSLPKLIEKPYFLAVNRFIPKKNLLFLISAYKNYRQIVGKKAWDLVLCGDGQLRSDIEKQIAQFGLENYVHLPGFLQQDALLPYFAHAECFIHASVEEPWGLVVNEAMAAGLPVIVSNRCGCFEDLVIEGVNGFGFNPDNLDELTNLLVKVSAGNIDVEKMKNASLEHIQKFSPDYFASGLIQAVKFALNN
ncbi:glycosyl transferase group 1 (plasmid) [Gloeothece citriformis PCC 7424]|uniref:Glycosyl transferase group 1 n=1 Tax=Gloeothece citriformis (strain PCC 7424) TaxID=65393 RepID=B7KM31_GLOC7|nr:glycosyltransferase family 4 protein [Gloeothece citriformis]ACK73853.1 glycosyl transferase group 1 [Gloeothece citriformis PCC 7424]